MRNRPGSRRRGGSATLAVAVLLALTACSTPDTGSGSSSSQPTGAADTVLYLAMDQSMESQQPDTLADPAFFYGGPGITLTNAVYDGLLRYKPNGGDSVVEGALASEWSTSSDGLTMTLRLRDAVFASGSPVTADDVVFSLRRFIDLNGGPSYMLNGVADVQALDDSTVILKLKHPVNPLEDYLASPYGPKIYEKAVVEAHEQGDDLGGSWLATHSAGSGPYSIETWEPNKSYTLKANPHYWGGAPSVPTVVITVASDSASQIIGLRSGTLDVTRLNQLSDYSNVSGDPSLKHLEGTSLLLQVFSINPTLPPFDNPDLRKAVRDALDKADLTSKVWGDLATPSDELLPPGMMAPTMDPDPSVGDPSALASLVSALPEDQRHVVFYYTTQPSDERMAQAIAAVLTKAGMNVELKLPSNGVEWWKSDSVNLYIQTTNPDAAHPDAWMQIFYKTTGFLNFLKGGSKKIDALIDQGQTARTPAESTAAYSAAAAEIRDQATFVTISSVKNAFGFTSTVDGLSTTPSAPFSVGLESVTKS